MHFATLEKSQRLQRVLDVLRDGKTHTTRDLIRKAQVCAVNSIVAEIRANGIQVDCRRSGDVWWYCIAEQIAEAG